MYGELSKNFADSPIVIFVVDLFFFVDPVEPWFFDSVGTIFFCICLKVPRTTPPPISTAPIKYLKLTAQASTPGARVDLIFDTHRTYCPENIKATFAKKPKIGSSYQMKRYVAIPDIDKIMIDWQTVCSALSKILMCN
jgi:hypothetical protein